MLVASVILTIILSTRLLPNLLLENLEYHTDCIPPESYDSIRTKNIVVLGAGHTDAPDIHGIARLSNSAIGRLAKGITIYRQIEGSRLVLSGYAGRTEISQARVMAEAAISLGVNPDDIILLESPNNTESEAKAFAVRFPGEREAIIVTDAFHMRRALYLFRGEGISPVPAPSNFLVIHDNKRYLSEFLPNPGNMDKLGIALHEYVGLLWAKIKK